MPSRACACHHVQVIGSDDPHAHCIVPSRSLVRSDTVAIGTDEVALLNLREDQSPAFLTPLDKPADETVLVLAEAVVEVHRAGR